jgi:excisionase family DNA binding protein
MGMKDTITLHPIGGEVELSRSSSQRSSKSDQQPPRRLAVSVTEAAALLGISRGLAYELVHRGELPVIQLGRRLVVPLVALERLVAAASPLTSTASDEDDEVAR